MVSRYHQMKLFTGTANPTLAQEIATHLGVSLGGVRISRFANGGKFTSGMTKAFAGPMSSWCNPFPSPLMKR